MIGFCSATFFEKVFTFRKSLTQKVCGFLEKLSLRNIVVLRTAVRITPYFFTSFCPCASSAGRGWIIFSAGSIDSWNGAPGVYKNWGWRYSPGRIRHRRCPSGRGWTVRKRRRFWRSRALRSVRVCTAPPLPTKARGRWNRGRCGSALATTHPTPKPTRFSERYPNFPEFSRNFFTDWLLPSAPVFAIIDKIIANLR